MTEVTWGFFSRMGSHYADHLCWRSGARPSFNFSLPLLALSLSLAGDLDGITLKHGHNKSLPMMRCHTPGPYRHSMTPAAPASSCGGGVVMSNPVPNLQASPFLPQTHNLCRSTTDLLNIPKTPLLIPHFQVLDGINSIVWSSIHSNWNPIRARSINGWRDHGRLDRPTLVTDHVYQRA